MKLEITDICLAGLYEGGRLVRIQVRMPLDIADRLSTVSFREWELEITVPKTKKELQFETAKKILQEFIAGCKPVDLTAEELVNELEAIK